MHSQQPPGVVQNRSTLQCSRQNTEQCGYDHAPVTRGRMRTQFPLPHGPFFQRTLSPRNTSVPTVFVWDLINGYLIRYRAPEPPFEVKGLGKWGAVVRYPL